MPILNWGWRAGDWICTDRRTSLRSTVELGFETRVKELAELGAVLHIVCSVPPHSPKFPKGRPFFAVGLKLDKFNKIAGDVVIRDGFLTEDGFIIVLQQISQSSRRFALRRILEG